MLFRNRNETKGFSLIELSIAMTLVGLFVATSLQTYKLYQQRKISAETSSRKSSISLALGKYIVSEGKYPCPAPQYAKPGDANYGVSDCSPVTDNIAVGSCKVSGGVNGVCRYAGKDDPRYNDPDPDNVLVGAVPFVTLGINPKDGLDGYGRRFTYAVSEELTETGTDFEEKHAIEMYRQFIQKDKTAPDFGKVYSNDFDRDDAGNEIVEDAIVLSHGQDGRGAYTVGGRLYAPCGTTGTDPENCDPDGTFRDPMTAVVSNPNSPDFNDDSFMRDIWEETNYWTYDTSGNANVYNRYVNRVGIGTMNPQTNMDVVGNIKTDGTVKVGQICNDDGADCFEPQKLGGLGDGKGMKCADDGLVTGFSYGQPECAYFNAAAVGLKPGVCPPGRLVNGVDAGGNISCAIP